ncbi:MAG: hypothetical protein KDK65_03590, partial [Chlamydiia bacterium]|nr:hypothetical protein [Chlamydiia bacterium]
ILNYPEVENGQFIQVVSTDGGLSSLGERLGVQLQNLGEQTKVIANDFGTATLFLVRDVFKNPWMMGVYTIFVLAACFHAFNGLWTFCISWGVTLSRRSQLMMRKVSVGLMVLIACLGLASIWLTYWVNLRT